MQICPIAIAKGKGKMPAFQRRFTADQVKDLVAYLTALGKKKLARWAKKKLLRGACDLDLRFKAKIVLFSRREGRMTSLSIVTCTLRLL